MSVFRYVAPLIACLSMLASAQAVEPRLRLGPSEVTAEAFLLNRYVRDGVTRIDTTTLHAAGSVRFLNLGVNIDTYTALDDDNDRGVDSFEIDEARIRFDYLIDVADLDMLTIIPFFETSFYPAKGNARTFNGNTANPILNNDDWENEPYWVGADAWYKLPYAGMEIGASLAGDVGGTAGLKGSIGARQFVQVGTIDFAAYQKINFADGNYRDHVIGIDRTGFTNAEIGLTITIPIPLEGVYVSAYGAGHVWIDSKSRSVVERSSVLVGGVSISFRLSEIGL